jgi:hypothetical protein
MYKCVAIISLMVVALAGCGEKSADKAASSPAPTATASAPASSDSSTAPAAEASSVWTSSGSSHESAASPSTESK